MAEIKIQKEKFDALLKKMLETPAFAEVRSQGKAEEKEIGGVRLKVAGSALAQSFSDGFPSTRHTNDSDSGLLPSRFDTSGKIET